MNSPDPLAELLSPVIADYHGAGRWYVALSGGLDSTVLLHLLRTYCARTPGAPPLSAIHINHQLQPAADHWQAHCRDVCAELGIPLLDERVDAVDTGEGPEATARHARYEVFERTLDGGEVLFMAHHLDDQVETVLLRLMRGAGLTGLAGMPQARKLGRGHLVRPLLAQPRSALREYASLHSLSWVEDPSNLETHLDRNYLRHEVMPLLAARWPGYRGTVARAAEHLTDAASLLARHFPVPATVHSACGDPGLPLAALPAAEPGKSRLVLRGWLLHHGLPVPEQAKLLEFLRQLNGSAPDARPRFTGPGYVLERYQQAVYRVSEGAIPEPLALDPGVKVSTAAGELSVAPADGPGFSLADGEQVEVRWRSGGERCRLLGHKHSTTLKKVLQGLAVPPWWRSRVPLAYIGGELVSLGGFALCDSSHARRAAGPGESLWKLDWRPNSHGAPIETPGAF